MLLPIAWWLEKDQPDAQRACARADLIILQRVLVEESIERAAFWKEKGKAVIVDFDDAYQLIREDNQAHSFWGRGEVEVTGPYKVSYKKELERKPVDQFSEAVARITGMTVAGKILAEDWRWAGKCWYVPNYIDSARYLAATASKRPSDKVVIGYGGSMSHVPSWELSGIGEALESVVLKRRNVQVLICGDQRVYDLLKIRTGAKRYSPYVPWYDWPKILAQFDIGLAPLARRYDDSRSFIKPMEYTVMGIPFAATRSPAYEEFWSVGHHVSPGEDDESRPARAAEWESVLLGMIDSLESEREAARVATEIGLRWDALRCAKELESVYSEILDAR